MLHVGEEIKKQSLFLGPGGCLVCCSEDVCVCVLHFFLVLFQTREAEEYLLQRFVVATPTRDVSGMGSNVIVKP